MLKSLVPALHSNRASTVILAAFMSLSGCSSGFTSFSTGRDNPKRSGDGLPANTDGPSETIDLDVEEQQTLDEGDDHANITRPIDGNSDESNTDLDVASDESVDASLDIEEKERLIAKCWFAVSGTFIGTPQYNSVFPNTRTGNPRGNGETFDDVGGVFLYARDEAYEYGKGDKEIDRAVDETFDSVVIAPGMRAEIRDASGTVQFEGEGPVIAISYYYGVTRTDDDHIENFRQDLKENDQLPEWMKTYLDERSSLEIIRLHVARSVRVQAVSSSECSRLK